MSQSGSVVYVDNSVKIGVVSKGLVSPSLFQNFNLVFRRLPIGITEENIVDTLDGFQVKNIRIINHSEDECIACVRLSNDDAKTIFEKLDKKVFVFEDVWYPIEMIWVEDYIKVRRSTAFEIAHSKTPTVSKKEVVVTKNKFFKDMWIIFKNIFVITGLTIFYYFIIVALTFLK